MPPRILSAGCPLLALGLLVACASPVERASGELPHRAYVWQRAWTPPVHEAVASHDFEGIAVLSHEISWRAGQPQVFEVALPPVQAARAVRIAVPPAGTDLHALLSPVLRPICAAGEVHIDMDLPTRRLPEYAAWLRDLRQWCEVRVTALPTWLDHPSFPEIAAGGFVLQVHWFDPERPTAPLLSSDAAQAIERAAVAGRGVPFEVALPAYGHRAWLRDGAFVALDSEELPAAPRGAVPHLVVADPHRVRDLLDGLEADRAAALTGVWWFRLPTAQDRLVWSDTTLRAVREGEPLRQELSIEREPSESGAVELCVRVDGNLPWTPAPIAVEAPLAGGRAGWTWSVSRSALMPPRIAHPLQPGERRCVGWSRSKVTRAP